MMLKGSVKLPDILRFPEPRVIQLYTSEQWSGNLNNNTKLLPQAGTKNSPYCRSRQGLLQNLIVRFPPFSLYKQFF